MSHQFTDDELWVLRSQAELIPLRLEDWTPAREAAFERLMETEYFDHVPCGETERCIVISDKGRAVATGDILK